MQLFFIIHSKVVIRVSSFVFFFFPVKIFGFRISFWRGPSKNLGYI